MNRNIQLELARQGIGWANQILVHILANFGSELDNKDSDAIDTMIDLSEKLNKRLRKKIVDEFGY